MKIAAKIGLGIIVVISLIFLLRGCQQGDSLQMIQDSLNREKAFNDTLILADKALIKEVEKGRAKNTTDSLTYNHKIDSQSRVIASLQGKFNITKDSIGSLYSQLKVLYDNHDSVALAKTYYDLRDQLTSANQQLFAIQIAHDSADFTRNAEIDRLNGLITQLRGQITTLSGLLLQCTDNASNLAKTGDLAIKKAKAGRLFAQIGAGIAAILAILLLTNK